MARAIIALTLSLLATSPVGAKTMPDPIKMEAAVNAYVAAFEAGSADQVAALYAADATVEDPIGSPIHKGREAIRAFYAESMKTGAKLKLEGPVRVAGDYAVFPFSVNLNYDGGAKRIDVIDTFRFNKANEVVEMRAFWGPNNMHGF
ncbi:MULTISPECIES: nuclear transport factor 2 family protein [unclassified Sphingobium]|uniref:nuclear transport factor 2 family protein n=1 Tax=unclassified Sphingobium TaxID=2611147 RepID=UPI001A11FB7C|nr:MULTISPECIES: nuclear transport factor 2 family protein [unclassified Sphingobium]CAD7342024.1 Steroid Delta-isomerase [Sphingobium sp. S6]CAD7342073.1 Steroid Delta-isomerase [Sphingobium sp. S8]